MDEVLGRDGSWTFDLAEIRLIPGHSRVPKLRTAIGEVAVPLEAVAGISFEPARKGGRLRLRLREGADPLTQATASHLPDNVDPYVLAVDADQTATSQYFAEAVRQALLVQQVPTTPVARYLLPAPGVPITAAAGDGTAHFDGETVRIEWNWLAKESKSAAGTAHISLTDIAAVEWLPQSGFSYGYLRSAPRTPATPPRPNTTATASRGVSRRKAAQRLCWVRQSSPDYRTHPPRRCPRAPRSRSRSTIRTRCCGGCANWVSCTSQAC
jgi:hypothetical protein